MKTKLSPVPADEFFPWIVKGFIVGAVVVLTAAAILFGVRGEDRGHRAYVSDFFAILQREYEHARYEKEIEGAAHFLRAVEKNSANAPLFDIALGYAVAIRGADAVGRASALQSAEKLIEQFRLDARLFERLRPFLENRKIGSIVADERWRGTLKSILVGEMIRPVAIDLTSSPAWEVWKWLLLIGQAIVGSGYFIGFLGYDHPHTRWWYVQYASPLFVFFLWFPVALPWIAIASMISLSCGITRRLKERRERTASASHSFSSLSAESGAISGDDPLLTRLTAKMRR